MIQATINGVETQPFENEESPMVVPSATRRAVNERAEHPTGVEVEGGHSRSRQESA